MPLEIRSYLRGMTAATLSTAAVTIWAPDRHPKFLEFCLTTFVCHAFAYVLVITARNDREDK